MHPHLLRSLWVSCKCLLISPSWHFLTVKGRNSCVGKQLGLMEIRYLTTEILSRYNIQFAPGNDPKTFLENKVDAFTAAVPDLNLVFTPRN